MRYIPYIHWEREDFEKHFEKQYNSNYNSSWEEVIEAIYSGEWMPNFDYDGCSVIQDQLHPFLPCFMHDYHYEVHDVSRKEADLDFLADLIAAETPPFKAICMYMFVRMFGWMKWE